MFGQRGMSLIVVLIIMIVVALLGAGGAQIALLAERGSRNDRDMQIAWQSSEGALMDAEFDLRTSSRASAVFGTDPTIPIDVNNFSASCGTSGNTQGLCSLPTISSTKPAWLTANFENDSAPTVGYGTFTSRTFPSGSAGLQPAKVPRYLIELIRDDGLTRDLSSTTPQYVFRVTAMGFGPRNDIQAVMQMLYRN